MFQVISVMVTTSHLLYVLGDFDHYDHVPFVLGDFGHYDHIPYVSGNFDHCDLVPYVSGDFGYCDRVLSVLTDFSHYDRVSYVSGDFSHCDCVSSISGDLVIAIVSHSFPSILSVFGHGNCIPSFPLDLGDSSLCTLYPHNFIFNPPFV